ncbi:hypothetical protein [Rickettsia asembonensis]|uniref:hypothetical protein n=1 Tax=Rickettsia asembonensis TaxID=1068590 RepID=UPI000ADD5C8A|nr:hypothetical protein [Rickettsia asembonensis]
MRIHDFIIERVSEKLSSRGLTDVVAWLVLCHSRVGRNPVTFTVTPWLDHGVHKNNFKY